MYVLSPVSANVNVALHEQIIELFRVAEKERKRDRAHKNNHKINKSTQLNNEVKYFYALISIIFIILTT